MSEENKALVRRWYEEGFNKRNMTLLNELFHPDLVLRAPLGGELRDLEATRQYVNAVFVAFPDGQIAVDDQVAEGDTVVTRFSFTGTHQGEFMGVGPTGKQITMRGATVLRVANGKIAEGWDVYDLLGVLQQMGAAPQPTGANKALARRFLHELINKREWGLADEIFADDIVMRAPHFPEIRGREAMTQVHIEFLAGFPDYRYAIEELIAEGDKVVVRWAFTGTHKGECMGVAPTGKLVSVVGTTTLRISGGKIVEHWGAWDALGFFQQLGAMPPLGKAEDKAAA